MLSTTSDKKLSKAEGPQKLLQPTYAQGGDLQFRALFGRPQSWTKLP